MNDRQADCVAASAGTGNTGVVTFHRLGENQTRMKLQMTIAGADVLEKIGESLGIIESQVQADTARFQEMDPSGPDGDRCRRGEISQTPT